MKLLIDTNVLIPLEPGSTTDFEPNTGLATELFRTAMQLAATLYLHPLQRSDIEQDKKPERRAVRLRLIERYAQIPKPPAPSPKLSAEIGHPVPGQNSWIDLHLIAALERDVVDILVSEDRGIHRCCKRLALGDRCLTIGQALAKLQDDLPVESSPPPAVRSLLAHELNDSDPIFSSFQQDYPGFSNWLAKCRSQHRQCWVVLLPGRTSYAGVCIVNREDRAWTDAEDPTLKICAFKIAEDVLGMKLGELLLRAVFDFAHANSFR